MAPSRYDLDPDKRDTREKHVGKLKFGADWQFGEDWTPDLIDHVLNLLMFRFSMPVEYLAVEESSAPWRIEALEYSGPQDQRGDDLALYKRAVLGKKQLTCVRELLRLYDKYGHELKGPDDFECLDPSDDRQKLREARRLMTGHSSAHVLPIAPVPDNPAEQITQAVPAAPPAVAAVPPTASLVAWSARKRGQKSKVLDRVKQEMLAAIKENRLTGEQLDNLREKQMEDDYGASRDTCRKARTAVLSEIGYVSANDKVRHARNASKLRQIATNDK